jgi:hypothetical protein
LARSGLADPDIKVRLADLGGTPLAGSPADFGKLVADETEKWAKVRAERCIEPKKSGDLPPVGGAQDPLGS